MDGDVEKVVHFRSPNIVVMGLVVDELEGGAEIDDVVMEVKIVCP